MNLHLESVQLINVLLTLGLILATCHRLNPPRLRIEAGLRLCMMNCFSFKGMMFGP